MKSKFAYLALGLLLAIAIPVFAAQVSVPSSPGTNYLLQGLSTGNWSASKNLTVVGTSTLATTTTSVLNGVVVVDGVHFPRSAAGIKTAIQVCSLMAGSCSRVHLTAGNYATSTTVISIPSSISIEGDGYATFLPFGVGGGFFISGVGSTTIAYMHIDATTDTNVKPIQITDAGNVTIDHVAVTNAYKSAVFIYSTNVATPTNAVWITNSYLTGQGLQDVVGGGPLDSN
jgi:hypothetical protein